MVNIAEQLFPNILTLLTQLIATAIIFIIYRRYVHQPVMKWLDKQADDLLKAQHYAEEVEQAAKARQQRLEADYNARVEALEEAVEQKKRLAEEERLAIIEDAKRERTQLLESTRDQLEQERRQMSEDLEDHIMDLAVDLSKQALVQYRYDEEDILASLSEEWEKMNHA